MEWLIGLVVIYLIWRIFFAKAQEIGLIQQELIRIYYTGDQKIYLILNYLIVIIKTMPWKEVGWNKLMVWISPLKLKKNLERKPIYSDLINQTIIVEKHILV